MKLIKSFLKNYLTIYPVVYNQIFKNARSWYKFTLAPILYIWGIIFIHLMLPMLIIAIGIEYVVKYIVNKIPNIFYKPETVEMFCDNCDKMTESKYIDRLSERDDQSYFVCTICKTQSKVMD
mgnify:CR=1 FL=1